MCSPRLLLGEDLAPHIAAIDRNIHAASNFQHIIDRQCAAGFFKLLK
jgi:hypothetical protein